MSTRRGFLGAMLAAAIAPAVVRSGILMPVRSIITLPMLWADGIHDDSDALQALLDGTPFDVAPGVEAPHFLRGSLLDFKGARHALARPLIFQAMSGCLITNGHFTAIGSPPYLLKFNHDR